MPSVFARFRTDTSGNIAIILGIAIIPLFAAAGLALDYAYAARERSDLQNAIDAAALSLAKLPPNTSQADLETRAKAFVAAYMPNSRANNFQVTVTPTKGQLKIDASANYPTAIVKVLDLLTGDNSHSNMTIGTSSTASWGNGKVEVALVLDNTGSMDGTKIANLKSAAKSLVQTLATQATEEDTVKIALVPFSSTVRLPTSFKSAAWMDRNAVSPISAEIFNGTTGVNRFDLFDKINKKMSSGKSVTWAGCVESRAAPYDVTDPSPSAGTPGTLIVPYFAPDEPDDTHDEKKRGKTTPVDNYANNYLDDGVPSYKSWQEKQGATAKYGTTSTKQDDIADPRTSSDEPPKYGPNAGCGMEPIVPLSTDLGDYGTVQTAIKNMDAVGNTNIPMGLAWGWYALSPNDMLSNNAPYDDEETAKVIVLMTDGDNTISSTDTTYNKDGSNYAGIGYIWQNRVGISNVNASSSARQTALDNRLKLLCSNIKALRKKAGSTAPAVEIYTVLVELDSKATSQLLSDCATTPDMFYNVAKSSDLVSVFNNIAGSIGRLHLSK